MSTPAATIPPTPETAPLYRAACLSWKQSRREELQRCDGDYKRVVWRVPLHAAALAVQELAPELSYQEAWNLGQHAVAWAGQAHGDWMSKE